jgi:hypothetical protein
VPDTHGSTSESSDPMDPFPLPLLAHHRLDASALREGTVLSSAMRRVREELRTPQRAWAGFDNKLSRWPSENDAPAERR